MKSRLDINTAPKLALTFAVITHPKALLQFVFSLLKSCISNQRKRKMAKVLFAIVALMGLVGCVRSHQQLDISEITTSLTDQQQNEAAQAAEQGGLGGLLGGLMAAGGNSLSEFPSSPMKPINEVTNSPTFTGASQVPERNIMDNSERQQQSTSLADLLRSIPKRGMEIIHNIMNSFRSMLPSGRGRQENNSTLRMITNQTDANVRDQSQDHLGGRSLIPNPLDDMSDSMLQYELPFANVLPEATSQPLAGNSQKRINPTTDSSSHQGYPMPAR